MCVCVCVCLSLSHISLHGQPSNKRRRLPILFIKAHQLVGGALHWASMISHYLNCINSSVPGDGASISRIANYYLASFGLAQRAVIDWCCPRRRRAYSYYNRRRCGWPSDDPAGGRSSYSPAGHDEQHLCHCHCQMLMMNEVNRFQWPFGHPTLTKVII